ncbi:hypothetical protein [Mesobacillus maritimus]|uniref:Uncharacterized protein n=1 Tax=Mesobacillus maritimus TaxID=1643336 RepID=A0ABS7K8R9_9BACI|nr:hypothetical protein [Mesobacillus maritimus]MBY0098668.1 hypothetical protein [Mesobacillus maritimus]
MKKATKDPLLVVSVEAHKKIITEGESVDLESILYEKGTPFDQVRRYNAYTILSKLQFPKDEILNYSSESRRYLDEIAAKDLTAEEIIKLLLEYRRNNGE